MSAVTRISLRTLTVLTAKSTLARRGLLQDDGLRVVTRILLVCTLLWPTRSKAQTTINELPSTPSEHTRADPGTVGFASIPELENRPRSDFENSVMSELACTCGTCKLELINACRCDFAAKMRGEVLAQLGGLDLSTEAARQVAAEAVRASFVGRYGRTVLDRTNRLDPSGRIAGFVVAALALSVLGVILFRRRSIRRRARASR
jgi:hypothetical protein